MRDDGPITERLDPGQVAALIEEGRRLHAAQHEECGLGPVPPPCPPADQDDWLAVVERIGRPGWRGE